ncbi:hypothetical protein GCM10009827_113320 [Dactylosporangium maewongense]|uniref:Uncharacterized protein n=1 Tax=Dactylosporangium maewongense TaxID=634393 RepID=A0ABN2D8N1_9ACTN
MTTELETLVRELQEQRADAAPDPDRIRGALPELIARRRTTRTVVATVAAVLVLALAVPVTLAATGRRQAGPPAASPGRATTPGIALRYSPTWVPGGYRERLRALVIVDRETGDDILRRWTDGPMLGQFQPMVRYLDLEILEMSARPGPAQDGAVDINGVPGTVFVGSVPDSKAVVSWQIDATHSARVEASPAISQDDILRVARSVRPDPAVFSPPVQQGRQGQLASGKYDMIADDPGHWGTTSIMSDVVAPLLSLKVTVGPAFDVPEGGDPVRVRGATGRIVATVPPASNLQWTLTLVVTLPDGRPLTVESSVGGDSPAAREALVRAVDGLVIDPAPDVSWAQ